MEKRGIIERSYLFLRLLHMDYRTTTPYHPQANGLTGRWNHTCAAIISMYVDSKHENWDEVLPRITFAYNSAKQESTKHSPFELIYARNPLLPIDVTLGVISGNPENKTQFAEITRQRAIEAGDWVKQHIP